MRSRSRLVDGAVVEGTTVRLVDPLRKVLLRWCRNWGKGLWKSNREGEAEKMLGRGRA